MRSIYKRNHSSSRASIATTALRAVMLLLASVMAVSVLAPNAQGTPPRSRQRSVVAQMYPQGFVDFMDAEFGRMWMHTVQERAVRCMYLNWLQKNSDPAKKDS